MTGRAATSLVPSSPSESPDGLRTSQSRIYPVNRWRLGKLEVERTLTLERQPDGTIVKTEIEWRFRPPLFGLYFSLLRRDQWKRAAEESTHRLRQFL